jgi:hypothetical protein
MCFIGQGWRGVGREDLHQKILGAMMSRTRPTQKKNPQRRPSGRSHRDIDDCPTLLKHSCRVYVKIDYNHLSKYVSKELLRFFRQVGGWESSPDPRAYNFLHDFLANS